MSTNFCFTLNNPESEPIYDPVVHKYLCYGRETAPTTGTPHLQGFVIFSKKCRISKKLQAIYGHMTQASGSPLQNQSYCSKGGDFVEYGAIPNPGKTEQERWSQARASAISGDLTSIPDDIYIRYYRTLKEIKKDHMVKPSDLTVLNNQWIYGTTGTGKSVKARTDNPGSFYKPCNKWWDGYQGEKTVIIEDFDKYNIKLGQELKIWGDYGHFIAETKGGAICIRPERIIITSNYHPKEIWDDEQTLDPILRRYAVFHLLNKNLK